MENKEFDLVIGFITGYKYPKIKPWVESLLNSGFTGQKMMVTYNIDQDLVEQLESLDFIVIPLTAQGQFNIVKERFLHTWQFLKTIADKPRYIISTDVADVIFQSNPSEWLEKNLGDKKICASAESLLYKDEAWGIHNMKQSFGPIAANYMTEMPIYNAGVTAGAYEEYIDLCYNMILSLRRFTDETIIVYCLDQSSHDYLNEKNIKNIQLNTKYLFKENFVIQSVIHVNLRYGNTNKLNLYKIQFCELQFQTLAFLLTSFITNAIFTN